MKQFLLILIAVIFYTVANAQEKKDIELFQTENGNEISFAVKNHLRDFMTVELSVTGTGFTCNVPLPAIIDLKSYEKKDAIKLTLAPSGSSYSISYKSYKTSQKHLSETPTTSQNSTLEKNSRAATTDLNKGIVLFTIDGCGRCAQALSYFKNENIPFKEINVSQSKEDEQKMWEILVNAGFADTSIQTPVVLVDGKAYYNMPDMTSFLQGLK